MIAVTVDDGDQFQVSADNSTRVTIFFSDQDPDLGAVPGGIIVPPNHYYRVTGFWVDTGSVWVELR